MNEFPEYLLISAYSRNDDLRAFVFNDFGFDPSKTSGANYFITLEDASLEAGFFTYIADPAKKTQLQ